MPQEPDTEQEQGGSTSDAKYLKPFIEKLYPARIVSVRVCAKDEVEAMCSDYHLITNSDGEEENNCPVAEILDLEATAAETMCADSNLSYPYTGVSIMSAVEWRNLQREDSAISRVIEMLKVPNNNNTADENPMVNLLLKERHRLVFRDDILFRHRLIDGMDVFQLVFPSAMRLRVLRGLQDDMEHLGRDKTIDLVCQRFYW